VRAGERLEKLHEAGHESAQLYGADPGDGVGGFGAFFLLLDEPEVYSLPPDPKTTTRDLGQTWAAALAAAAALGLGLAAATFGGRR
jgi:formate dehydrogenase iron-sulfur subunit